MRDFRKSESNRPENQKKGRPSVKDQKAMDDVVRHASHGESISNIAKRKGMPCKTTIYVWMRCPVYRARFSQALESHHLKKSDGRPYQMRVMIDRGNNKVGLRKTIPLETHDLEEAKIKRDANIAMLRSLGIKLIGHFPLAPRFKQNGTD